MNNKLVITRKKELNNRGKPYQIFINGKLYGSISYNGDDQVFFFDADEIEIFFKVDWCYSQNKIISFDSKKDVNLTVKSSIPNYLWFFIVIGITVMISLFLLYENKYFTYLSFLFILIPLYKISVDKNNYLIISSEKST